MRNILFICTDCKKAIARNSENLYVDYSCQNLNEM